MHSSPRQEHIDASKVFPVRLAARTTLLPHAATHHDSVVLLPLESVHGVNRNPVLNAFRGGGLSQLQYFLALAFMGVTPTDTRNATRCKSSVSRWISVSCSPWATTSSCRCRCCRRGGDAVLSCLRGTHVTTWMMPMCVSLLHRECRRGLVLEPAGTLAMTRKMLLLIKARNRRPVRAWRWMHDRQMRTRAKP